MNIENFNCNIPGVPSTILSDHVDYRVDRNFEELITERGQSFEESEVYSRIFLEIKGLLKNDSEDNTIPETESLLFEEKYFLSNSIKSIDRVKKLIIDINNNKMEADVLFNYSNTEYTKYVKNILLVIEDIDNSSPESESEKNTELKELLSARIEWYHSFLNITELKKKCDSIDLEYSQIKKLLFSFSSILPPTICQICISKTVEYFIDPCGHTLCRQCMDKSNKLPKCHFCRNTIHKFKKLYL